MGPSIRGKDEAVVDANQSHWGYWKPRDVYSRDTYWYARGREGSQTRSHHRRHLHGNWLLSNEEK